MSQNSMINTQITDSIKASLTTLIGGAPSQPMAIMNSVMVETLGMAMHNAVNTQHNAQMVSSASTTAVCTKLLNIFPDQSGSLFSQGSTTSGTSNGSAIPNNNQRPTTSGTPQGSVIPNNTQGVQSANPPESFFSQGPTTPGTPNDSAIPNNTQGVQSPIADSNSTAQESSQADTKKSDNPQIQLTNKAPAKNNGQLSVKQTNGTVKENSVPQPSSNNSAGIQSPVTASNGTVQERPPQADKEKPDQQAQLTNKALANNNGQPPVKQTNGQQAVKQINGQPTIKQTNGTVQENSVPQRSSIDSANIEFSIKTKE
ncbi:hypothetical protein GMMP15_1550008 [Candidatus Magnetomoraceae bacterium gMMP-15]